MNKIMTFNKLLFYQTFNFSVAGLIAIAVFFAAVISYKLNFIQITNVDILSNFILIVGGTLLLAMVVIQKLCIFNIDKIPLTKKEKIITLLTCGFYITIPSSFIFATSVILRSTLIKGATPIDFTFYNFVYFSFVFLIMSVILNLMLFKFSTKFSDLDKNIWNNYWFRFSQFAKSSLLGIVVIASFFVFSFTSPIWITLLVVIALILVLKVWFIDLDYHRTRHLKFVSWTHIHIPASFGVLMALAYCFVLIK